MGSPTSVTTENPEPRRLGGAGSKGNPTAIHRRRQRGLLRRAALKGSVVQRGAAERGAYVGAGRVGLLLRGVLPLPSFGAAAPGSAPLLLSPYSPSFLEFRYSATGLPT